MDIQSMADYFASEIYIGNFDWRDTLNTMLWRGATINPANPYSDGRWRYILCDTEFSSSIYKLEETMAGFDSFSRAMNNHPLFASVIRNSEFQGLFKTALMEIARINFASRDVEADIKTWAKRWKPYMPYYYKRFGDTSQYWRNDLKSTIVFFQQRAEYILSAIS